MTFGGSFWELDGDWHKLYWLFFEYIKRLTSKEPTKPKWSILVSPSEEVIMSCIAPPVMLDQSWSPLPIFCHLFVLTLETTYWVTSLLILQPWDSLLIYDSQRLSLIPNRSQLLHHWQLQSPECWDCVCIPHVRLGVSFQRDETADIVDVRRDVCWFFFYSLSYKLLSRNFHI